MVHGSATCSECKAPSAVLTQTAVDHPAHYNFGKIEVIDAIDDWQCGFYEGNVIKYVARAKHKGNELEDLKKAQWYLARRIQALEDLCHS